MTMTTGERIKRYRIQNGMSQRDLEDQIDLSQSTITRIENGQRAVKPYEISAIAVALGCPESSLMETHPLRNRVQYAARTSAGKTPDTDSVKDYLLHLLEMDNYLTRALKGIGSA